MGAGGLSEADHVVAHGLVHVDVPHETGQLGQPRAVEHGLKLGDGVRALKVEEHLPLGGRVQIAEPNLDQEAVKLRLGQGERALVLDRILGGKDDEGLRQGARQAVDGDLALAHALEQRGLGAWGGAVDFVCQEQVREDRAGDELEGPALLIEDGYAGDVAGQEIGRALEPAEGHPEGGGDRARKHGLADARHIFDQDVPLGQERGED